MDEITAEIIDLVKGIKNRNRLILVLRFIKNITKED